ncbi:hypothetical protein ACFRFH_10830 [Leifsonia sp. NPDC056824]|uniref:hypothetical protein n=1 Tax=Leifsonia sp. NPDC056824 TaxID=3345953 RepID=UPI003689517B
MSAKVSVDTDRLRAGASTLSAKVAEVRDARFDAGDLGSPRADAGFVEFERYWAPGRSALAQSEDTLVEVLTSAADGYTKRDADSARAFSRGLRAF